jgi:hypothetical protein
MQKISGFIGQLLFHKEKVIGFYAWLMLVAHSDSEKISDTDFIFSEILVPTTSQKYFDITPY